MSHDALVLGAGPGGTAAARELAVAGRRVGLIEMAQWGGTCLNRGCIPTKLLLGAVAPLHLARAQERLRTLRGVPETDYGTIHTRTTRFLTASSQALAKSLQAAGVELIPGRAALAGRHTVRVQDAGGTERILEAGHIIIATGSRNAAFPGLVPDGQAVLDSTMLLELSERPESLLVIGAGAIGLELGDFFAALGTKVTIVEAAPHIAPSEDADIAAEMARATAKAGKTCITGVKAKEIITRGGQAELTLEDGRILTAEKALVAVGRAPNTAGLGCELAGISLNRRGFIVVDGNLLAAPDIYAVGDINGLTLLAHAAEHQASYVVRRILGQIDAPYASGPMPSCIYGSTELMRAGKTAREALQSGGAVSVSVSPLSLNAIAQASGVSTGFVKAVWEADRLVGMAAVGHGVSHLVTVAQMLVAAGHTYNAPLPVMFAHPTLDESVAAALRAPRKPAAE